MSVFIVGGAGFIGRNLMEYLLSEKRLTQFIIVDHCKDVYGADCPAKHRTMQQWEQMDGVSTFRTLPAAERTVREVKPDWVIHLAGLPNVRVCNENPLRCHTNNDDLMQEMLGMLKAAGLKGTSRVIFTSSSTVYGDSPSPWNEETTPHPLCNYATSKLRCETLLKESGFAGYILRLFSVYGKYGRPDMFPSLLMQAVRNNTVFEYHNTSDLRRDFTWVGDIVSFIAKVMRQRDIPPQPIVLNLGSGNPLPLSTVQKEIEQIGGPIRTFTMPREIKGNVDKTFADNARAQALGFGVTEGALRIGLNEQWSSMEAEHPRVVSEVRGDFIEEDLHSACVRYGCAWWHSVRIGECVMPLRSAIVKYVVPSLSLCGEGVMPAEEVQKVVRKALQKGWSADFVVVLCGCGGGFLTHRQMEAVRTVLACKVVAVIATMPDREGDLLESAVQSVLKQTASHRISEVLVVLDKAEKHATLPPDGKLTHLHNTRTIGCSGTGPWNTAINHIHDHHGNTTWVAILDDDDTWCDLHVEENLIALLSAKEPTKVEMCVSGLLRHTTTTTDDHTLQKTTKEPIPPTFPTTSELVTTNPGIQGSNLFVQCGTLVEAGMFDEGLPAGTDRDLCIRLRDLWEAMPERSVDTAYVSTHLHTVNHNAADTHERVSTPGPKKAEGLKKFFYKHRPRMTTEEADKYLLRAKEKFSCEISEILEYCAEPAKPRVEVVTSCESQRGVLMNAKTEQRMKELMAVANGNEVERRVLFGVVTSCLKRITPLLKDVNCFAEAHPTLPASVVVFFNSSSKEDYAVLRDVLSSNGFDSDKAFTADAPEAITALRHIPGGCTTQQLPIAHSRSVLQHMMYKTAVSEDADAVVVLDDDKRIPTEWGLMAMLDSEDIFIGRDIKTAPNTVFMSLRTQLCDLIASERCREEGIEVAAHHDTNERDCYYDLSSARFDHLEMPRYFAADMADIPDNKRTEDVVEGLLQRILKGDPLAREAIPDVSDNLTTTTQRGGCMLVPRSLFQVLLIPQYTPYVETVSGPAALRRSDSFWCKNLARSGVICKVGVALSVIHDNVEDVPGTPQKVRENALLEMLGSALCAAEANLTMSAAEHIRRRVQMMRRSLMRITVHAHTLRGISTAPSLDTLDAILDADAWETDVFAPARCFADTTADTVLQDLLTPRTPMNLPATWTVCGSGKEGTVYRDGCDAVKVFTSDFISEDTEELIQAAAPLFPGLRLDGSGHIRRRFVEGREYRGGVDTEKALIALLQSWHRAGLVMTNFKRENVVQSGTDLHIIDFGRSVKKASPGHTEDMWRRAFLTLHFTGYSAEELADACRKPTEPELTGFDEFKNAVNQTVPITTEASLLQGEASVEERSVKEGGEEETIALVAKCCPQDHRTIVGNVRQIVGKLTQLAAFCEVVLLVDLSPPPGEAYLRAQCNDSFSDMKEKLLVELRNIETSGLVTRIEMFGEDPAAILETNLAWFGKPSPKTHSAGGQPYASILHHFLHTTADIVLQTDNDILINLNGCTRSDHDINAHIIRYFTQHPNGVTLEGLPTCNYYDERSETRVPVEYEHHDPNQIPFRVEVRFASFYIKRLKAMLPLCPSKQCPLQDGTLRRPWYRIMDEVLLETPSVLSSRYKLSENRQPFFVHPENHYKKDQTEYMLVADRVVSSLPLSGDARWKGQTVHGNPNLKMDAKTWFAERSEALVVLVQGYNVPLARAKQCLRSLFDDLQNGAADLPEVGVIISDDASDAWQDTEALCEYAKENCSNVSFISHHRNVGYLANFVHCVSQVCANPDTIIITLDMDDRLVSTAGGKGSVLAKIWNAAFADRRFDVAIGGMLRPDKPRNKPYPVEKTHPRFDPGAAGNVWTHARCFRKRLFDAIRPADLMAPDGDYFTSIGADWVYMIPMVEKAGPDRVFAIDFPTYLFLPSTVIDRAQKTRTLDGVRTILQSRLVYPMATVDVFSSLLYGLPWTCTLYPEGLVVQTQNAAPSYTLIELHLDTIFAKRHALQALARSEGPLHVSQGYIFVLFHEKSGAPPCACCPTRAHYLAVHALGVEASRLTTQAPLKDNQYPHSIAEKEVDTDTLRYHLVYNTACKSSTRVRVRVHSECVTGDIFGSLKCDCGDQLGSFLHSMEHFSGDDPFLLVYIYGHEGRGLGLRNKLREYEHWEHQTHLDHESVLEQLGCPSDKRSFADVCTVLKENFCFEKVVLLSNNPDKKKAFCDAFDTVDTEAMQCCPNRHNRQYLEEKTTSPRLNQEHLLCNSLRKVPAVLTTLNAELHSHAPSTKHLAALMQSILKTVPFHNLPHPETDPLSLTGGRCTKMNDLLFICLRHLGYEAFMATGLTTQGKGEGKQGHDHGLLLVQIDGKVFWADVGNGRPYYSPVELPVECGEGAAVEDASGNPLYVGVRIVRVDDVLYDVQHRRHAGEWHTNYTFSCTALPPAAFKQIAKNNETDVDATDPDAMRFCLWADDIGISIKGTKCTLYANGQHEVIPIATALPTARKKLRVSEAALTLLEAHLMGPRGSKDEQCIEG